MEPMVTEPELKERLNALETQVRTLAQTVRTLADALGRLEGLIPRDPEEERLSRAARLSQEILLAPERTVEEGLEQLAALVAVHADRSLDELCRTLVDHHPSDGHDDMAVLALRTPWITPQQ
jgi:hypothetical protein